MSHSIIIIFMLFKNDGVHDMDIDNDNESTERRAVVAARYL